jgi:hypothetical protein
VEADKANGACRVVWPDGTGPAIRNCRNLRLRGAYRQGEAKLLFSLDGKTSSDTGHRVLLHFAAWKGARFGVFRYGSNSGYVDVDYVRYDYRSTGDSNR